MGRTTDVALTPQCLQALEQANQVRFARADLKRRVKAGGVAAAEVVLSSPWQTRTMSVGELLMSQRGWGRTRTRRLLASLAVPENKQIATLTERQRLAIVATLSRQDATGVSAPVRPRTGQDRAAASSR
jgi:hypothetical protein